MSIGTAPLAGRAIAALAAVLAATAGGCGLATDYGGGDFRCSDQQCPAGLVCVDERCVTAGPTPDGAAGDDALADAPLADALVADAALDAAAPDSCFDALDLDPLGASDADGATILGDTAALAGDLSTNGCIANTATGRDAIYRVSAGAGQTIHVDLVPDGWDAGVYILPTCATQACLAGADALGTGSETTSYAVTGAAVHYVVVDSQSTLAGYAGPFALTVRVE